MRIKLQKNSGRDPLQSIYLSKHSYVRVFVLRHPPPPIRYLFLMGIIQNNAMKAEAEAPQLPPYLVGKEETSSRYEGLQLTSTSVPGPCSGLTTCPQRR